MLSTCWQNKSEHTKTDSTRESQSSTLPSTGLTSAGVCSSRPPVLFSLVLSISRQASPTEVLPREACEWEGPHAGERKDSLDNILLILPQRGMDFLWKEYLWMRFQCLFCHKSQILSLKPREKWSWVWSRSVSGNNLHSVAALLFYSL